MKKFLICTDFSKCSQNAVRFGAEMAAHSGAEVILMHAFFLNAVPNANTIPQNYVGEISDIQKVSLEKQLVESAENLSKNHAYSDGKPLKSSSLVANGIADTEIGKAAKVQQTDLIIIGTKGENAFSRFFFGSISDELLDSDLPCPLLAVPEKCHFNTESEIVFAGTKDEGDIPSLMQLKSLSSSFAKNINYLSVNKLGEEIYELPDRFQSLSGVDFAEISAENVETGIHNFVREINADLLVMHKHEKSFFESLSEVSHTEEMLHSAALPLLIYKDYL